MKKKGMIITIIILVVAVALTIVFINLFREKDTKALSNKVHEVVSTGYLSDESDVNQKYTEYLDELLTLPDFSTTEKNEMTNYLNAFVAFEVLGDFFDRELVYAKFSEAYQQNKPKIENCFKDAQKAAESLYKYLEENSPQGTWKAFTWADCDDYVKTVYSNTKNAILYICDVYEGSISSKLMNNDFTKVAFDVIEELLDKKEDDLKINTADYVKLNNMVKNYFLYSNLGYILNYQYNDSVQAKIKEILTDGTNADLYKQQLIAGIL